MITDITNISNEQIGEVVKSDPNMAIYFSLVSQVKDLRSEVNMLKANEKIRDVKIEGHENRINKSEEKIGIVENRTEKLENKIDNFRNDTTGKYELFKATARARVFQLVGSEGSLKYILFYSSFILKIYSDIYNHFGVNNTGSIKMKDADTAIDMTKSWNPSMKYIRKKMKEFQRMDDNGTLKEPRKTALNKFLEETDGGINIEF